jgi:hypothetical protein
VTVLGSLNVRCRHCGANSEQTVMVSTSTFGAPDLDLRPAEMKRSSMAAWLQLCPHCGYCVPHISEGVPEGSVLTSDSYRATLRDERYPELARRFLAHALATAHSEPVRSAWAYFTRHGCATMPGPVVRRLRHGGSRRTCSAAFRHHRIRSSSVRSMRCWWTYSVVRVSWTRQMPNADSCWRTGSALGPCVG